MKSHGATRGRKTTPEYNTWSTMVSRCENENIKSYKDYGGRGIRVCSRWRRSFAAFLADMGKRPSPRHTLDRIDNSKGYFRSNCRWATRTEQANNKRNNRILTLDGISDTLQGWSRRTGIDRNTIATRLRAGASIKESLTVPASRTAYFKSVTHCPKGHEYTQDNTVTKMRGKYLCRSCRECARIKSREYHHLHRKEILARQRKRAMRIAKSKSS